MSDQKSKQICRFCQREMKVIFYCEDCGVACCSDCLRDDFIDDFVCQDCNSKDIEFNQTEEKKVCKECGTENVIKTTHHYKSCPKCHSHKVLNIYEKKEELEQKFLELIKLSRNFIQPIRDVINELYLIRHNIKKSREPPIRCYHYPKMESELLALFKQVEYLKENLLGKINTHFRHLAMNKVYFLDIYNQPNSNVRIIESILESVNQGHDSIDNFVTKNIKEILEKFEDFQKNLQFIEKITKLYLPYQQFLNLAEKEKPVYAIKTKLTNGLDPQKRFKKSNGILFITNFDLSFVHEYGFIKKKRELIFKAPVDDLIKIRDRGKLFKKLLIQFEYGKYEFSFPSNVVSKIIDYILLARNFQENEIYDKESAKKLQEIEIDLNDLVRYIEEGINSFFNLKCQINQNVNNSEDEEFESYFNSFQKHPQYWTPKYMNNHISANPPCNSRFYSDINSLIPDQEDYNYYRNRFNPQYPYNPYRFQSYVPIYNYQYYDGPYPFNNRSDFDERNILMKRLKRAQRFDQQFPPRINGLRYNNFNEMNAFRDCEPMVNDNFNDSFNDYHKNHISDLFNQEEPPIDNIYDSRNHIYEFDKKIYKRMMELKREKYSLKETLKKLDDKFDQGIIREVDYFKTFKNLQKEIYLIDKKIKSLSKKVKDDRFFRRKFNKKGYYS
ncbi:MAG: B-box zinc finger protein [Candidatus Hodarchaeota archaeon]